MEKTGSVVLAVAAAAGAATLWREGVPGLLTGVTKAVRTLPGVNQVINVVLAGEVDSATKSLVKVAEGDGDVALSGGQLVLREEPMSEEEIAAVAAELQKTETHAEDGRAFAYCYTSESRMAEHSRALRESFAVLREATGAGPEHDAMVARAFDRFMHDNALNPMIFPSLRKFETEVVSVCAGLMGGNASTVGAMTSGTPENALMAVKAYRSQFEKASPDNASDMELVLPVSAAGEWARACHVLGVRAVWAPLAEDKRVDVSALRGLLSSRTIAVVVSAPQPCHGVIDPVAEVAAVARRRGIPVHVDAALGGMLLPWVGEGETSAWDLTVKGVESVSLDLGTYGYAGRGSGILLYSSSALRANQYFAYAEWPGGLFGSPSLLGTRAGGNLAAAWAAVMGLGASGYRRLSSQAVEKAKELARRVAADISGLEIVCEPEAAVVSLAATPEADGSTRDVAELQTQVGAAFPLQRRANPACLTINVTPLMDVDALVAALQAAVAAVQPSRHSVPLASPEEKVAALAGLFGASA